MSLSIPVLRFANGDGIPQLGLGTWKSEPGQVGQAVKAAIELGVRHIDCAAIYGNEKEIGVALQEIFASGKVKREELWITSKLWNDAHQKEEVQPALAKTLADLQLEYLDLYLVHWPVASKKGGGLVSLEDCPLLETWRGMEAVCEKGLSLHIGVSNFSVKKLEELICSARLKPEVNQVELHPYLQQNEMLSYCKKKGVFMMAYSPLGSPGRPSELIKADEPVLLREPVLLEIAREKGVSVAQLLLAWALKRRTIVIPKSVNQMRIKENVNAGQVVLLEDDMQKISALDKCRRYVDGTFWVVKEGPYTLASLWDE